MKKTFQKYSALFKRVLLTSLFLIPGISLYAQNTRSLQEIQSEFQAGLISSDEAISRQLTLMQTQGEIIKCATPLFLMMNKYESQLKEETRSAFNKAFGTPVIASSESFISASGKFIVHYETTGNDAVPLGDVNSNSVPDYVEWIAEAADSSYQHILGLGFSDIFIQKSTPYEIRVANSNAYGFTPFPDAPYIGIENDFVGFPSNTDPEGDQKGAVKVTVAHELKHVFQYVQNGWDGDPDRWLEMDATLYEEVVYDQVNDYYNYLDGFADNFFASPNRTLIPGSYEDIVWALYFEERFGSTFWTNVWDRIEASSPNLSYLDAIKGALSDFDLGFEEAATENFLWHYASGSENSTPFFGFDESEMYPDPDIENHFDSLQLALTEPEFMTQFSGTYYEFDLIQENNQLIQIDYIPSSSDVQLGLIVYNKDQSIETMIFTTPDPEVLNSKQTLLSWSQIDRLGVVFFNTSSDQSVNFQFQVSDYFPVETSSPQLAQNYPNPFNPSTTIAVTIPFSQYVKLTVYDYLGREVQVLQDGTLSSGLTPIRFNATNLASGIYFYRLETTNDALTKKMTLIK